MTSFEIAIAALDDEGKVDGKAVEAMKICDAADDLLAACEMALPIVREILTMGAIVDDPSDRLAFDALEAAIAKARGETTEQDIERRR